MNFSIDTTVIKTTSIHYWHILITFLFAHWKGIVLASAIFTPLLTYLGQRQLRKENHLSQLSLQEQSAAFQEQLEVSRHAQREQQVILMDLLSMKRDVTTETMKYKLKQYQDVITPISEFMSKLLFLCEASPPGDPNELFEEFYVLRLQALSQITLFAPQEVFERFRDLLNYLFLVMRGDDLYSLDKVTEYEVLALNSIREDIGIVAGEVVAADFGMPENLLIESKIGHHTIWKNLRPVAVGASLIESN